MCLYPLVLRPGDGDLSVAVRCGQCRVCRVRRKQAWVGRLRLELQDHESARFLTLTYRDDNRPHVLDPSHLRDFLKRYRYYYGPCRYFAVGEYGEKNGNAHWHLIIFGHAPIWEAQIRPKKGYGWKDNQAWPLGFTHDAVVNQEVIGYISGYTLKGGDDKDHRPICRQSLKPGIGFRRIQMLARQAPKELPDWPHEIRIGGHRYPLTDGGLTCFQAAYIEAGGKPPVSASPMLLHVNAMLQLGDLGSRLRSQRVSLNASFSDGFDVYKAKKA